MKLYLDCIPCFQRQTLFATKNLDDEKRGTILRKVMTLLLDINWDTTSDEIVNHVHCLIRESMGIYDPYAEVKKISNEQALELYPVLKSKLEKINDKEKRIFTAAKLAIAGNIIDFGPTFEFDLKKTISEVVEKELAINNFDILYEKILFSDKLLYFADNAGEIVFDKLFIEEMIKLRKKPFDCITFVVKGGPIINDAMLEDAQNVGIDNLPNVKFEFLGNGQAETGPSRRDSQIKEWIKENGLVISKGQGNFEGLSNNKGIFFMLMAKCPIIARELKVNVMDTIIKLS
jgi:hypothetical protein